MINYPICILFISRRFKIYIISINTQSIVAEMGLTTHNTSMKVKLDDSSRGGDNDLLRKSNVTSDNSLPREENI